MIGVAVSTDIVPASGVVVPLPSVAIVKLAVLCAKFAVMVFAESTLLMLSGFVVPE